MILTTLQFWEENLTTLEIIFLHRRAVISYSYYWSWSISKVKSSILKRHLRFWNSSSSKLWGQLLVDQTWLQQSFVEGPMKDYIHFQREIIMKSDTQWRFLKNSCQEPQTNFNHLTYWLKASKNEMYSLLNIVQLEGYVLI